MDLEILQKFKEGSDAAFAVIYKNYYQGLYNTCFKFIQPKGKKQDAEDIVNIIFQKLYERRAKMNSMPSITNFLYLAMRTMAIDFLRKVGKSVEFYKDDISEFQIPINDELDIAFLERLGQEEQVLKFVSQLPKRCKQVITLYYLENMKYSEIADQLQVSIRTVENQLRYALNKLRKTFKTTYDSK